MESTFPELKAIQNFHITFEVDFMGELARDLGLDSFNECSYERQVV